MINSKTRIISFLIIFQVMQNLIKSLMRLLKQTLPLKKKDMMALGLLSSPSFYWKTVISRYLFNMAKEYSIRPLPIIHFVQMPQILFSTLTSVILILKIIHVVIFLYILIYLPLVITISVYKIII